MPVESCPQNLFMGSIDCPNMNDYFIPKPAQIGFQQQHQVCIADLDHGWQE